MLFSNIAVLNERFEIELRKFVGVSGKIDYIGDEPPGRDFGEVYDGEGKLLMPGFVNAHSHLGMAALKGYGEGLPLKRWLNEQIFPFEAKLTPEDIYWSMLMGIAEGLRFGVTSSTDMYFCGEAALLAVTQSGVKCNFSLSVSCFDERGYRELPAYRETLELIEANGNPRLKIDLALHSEYTTTPKVALGLAAFARESGLSVHAHVSETRLEHEECKSRHGKTPVRYLSEAGIFDNPATAAHCVYAEPEDIQILKDYGVTVATCPKSNLKLGSGVLNAGALLDAGVNVAIGTDSVASNNNLNMLEEIKVFSLINKGVFRDPTRMAPALSLFAATRAGAMAQRRDTGVLARGMEADLIVLDVSAPHMAPQDELAANVVYSACGTDVVLSMVDGRTLYRDGRYTTIDIGETARRVSDIRKRIAGELNA